MLFKLIKHNLKPIFKSILPFMIALLISIILFNVTGYEVYLKQELMEDGHFLYTDYVEVSGLRQFLHGFFNFTTICSIILLFAATIKTIWHHFKTTFYSDQAYLTHTLPVTRKTLWNAEICSVLITFASVLVALILGGFLLSLSKYGLQFLDSFGLVGGCSNCVGEYYHVEPLDFSFYLGFAFTVFTEFIFLTLCGITGIIIKHRLGKNLSLILGLAIYMLGGLILLGIFYLIAKLFDPALLNIFNGAPIHTFGYDPDISFMTRALCYIGSIYFVYNIILYFVNQKLLRRGINLD